jgi:hypothetical protein
MAELARADDELGGSASITRRITGRPTAPPLVASVELERAFAWLLAFAPTVYLALSGGGYDVVPRSQVGIALWWVLLLGALVGLLPIARPGRVGWAALALLAAFLAWTWIAAGWSQSEERTLTEAGRVAAYLGVLALGLSVVSRRSARSLLNGLACAVALVAVLAVLSRLVPSWFPANSTARFYATDRLSYPFDYSDGVGEFAALGLPLLLFAATGARTIAGRALSAAGLPVISMCLAMTVSRGGVLAAAVGLVAFFALADDRLPRLFTGAVAAAGSAISVAALVANPGVRTEFLTSGPGSQRHAVLLVLVLACAAVAAAVVAFELARRRFARPAWLSVSRGGAQAVTALIAAGVIAAVIVLIASGADHRLWTDFKKPNPPSTGGQYSRLFSISGSHRYQYWRAALHAFRAHPLKGIGPGTFEFYWAQHNSLGEFVRNAHSLWIETLAEDGIIGALLIVGLFGLVLIAGSVRALRAAPPMRLVIATGTAGVFGFCAAAAFDWVWQLAAVPFVGLLLAAAAMAPSAERERSMAGRRAWIPRGLLALAAIPALWAIVVPLAETVAIRSSQSAAQRGEVIAALSDAATARRLEPGAATPWLQQALLLEKLRDIPGAEHAIVNAEARESTNWRIWLVGSRIATEADHPRVALGAYRRARRLNPTSPIFRP